ncbi:MAG: FHA domain-containing protein [Caldilineaceae bacterium]
MTIAITHISFRHLLKILLLLPLILPLNADVARAQNAPNVAIDCNSIAANPPRYSFHIQAHNVTGSNIKPVVYHGTDPIAAEPNVISEASDLRIAIVTDITKEYDPNRRKAYINRVGATVERFVNTYLKTKTGAQIGLFWTAPGGQVSQYGQWQVNDPSKGENNPALLFASGLVNFADDNSIPELNLQADEIDAAIGVIRILKDGSNRTNALLVIANGLRGTQTPVGNVQAEASTFVNLYAAAINSPGEAAIDEQTLRELTGNQSTRYGVLGTYDSLDVIWQDMVSSAGATIEWDVSYETASTATEVHVAIPTSNGQIPSPPCALSPQIIAPTAIPTVVTPPTSVPTVTPVVTPPPNNFAAYKPYVLPFVAGLLILWGALLYFFRRTRRTDDDLDSDKTQKRLYETLRKSNDEPPRTKKVNPPPPPIEVPVESDPALARLVKLQGAAGDEVMWLDGQGDITKFGRAKEEVDKVIENDNISRSHFKIEYKIHDDSYYITDNDSANGTFVNGEAITGPTKLQKDAEISLHVDAGTDIVYRFERPEPKSIPDPHTAAKGVTKKVVPRAASEEKQPPPAPEPDEPQSQADKRRTTKKQKPAK